MLATQTLVTMDHSQHLVQLLLQEVVAGVLILLKVEVEAQVVDVGKVDKEVVEVLEQVALQVALLKDILVATVNYVSAGGGGAGAAGGDVPSDVTPGAGGVGLAVNILNSTNATTASVGEVSGGNVYYAGGGGGSNESSSPGAAGGLGGGTNGAAGCPGTAPLAGVANTGGGNGGTGGCGSAYSTGGGSGVIILRYPSVYTATVTGTQASGSPFTEGTNKVSVFTAGTGTVTFSL